MTISGTTKLPTDALKFLPAKLRKRWKKSRVYYTASDDTLVVKRVRPAIVDYEAALADFQKLGKLVSRKEVREAIAAARKKH